MGTFWNTNWCALILSLLLSCIGMVSCGSPSPVESNSPVTVPTNAIDDSANSQEGNSGEEVTPPSDSNSSDQSPDENVPPSQNETPDETVDIDPNGQGPFSVLTEDGVSVPGASGRVAEVRICSPASDDGSRIADGEFPLLLIFPGFQLTRDQYTSYCEFFASWGFIAFAVTYSEGGFNIDHEHVAEDVPAMIDWATDPNQSISQSVNSNAIGVGGHSLGGKISIMAAALDSRIGVVLGWDPVEGMGAQVIPEGLASIQAPLLLMGETLDSEGSFQACAPADGNYTRFYEGAPNAALEVTVHGADHMDWVDDPSCFVCGFCKDGALEDEVVKALTRRTSVAFARRHLLGDESMERYLTGAIMAADEQSGLVSIQAKGF